MVAHRRRRAPVDRDFFSWASSLHGEATARAAANFLGVATYDADPGRLSAAFVWDLLLRVTAPHAPAVRWVLGGWPAVIDRLAARARELGVAIVTSSRVDALPEPPVIVATQLESARALLGDRPWPGRAAGACCSTSACTPTGATRSSSPTSTTPGSSSASAAPDPSLAPAGHSLVQATCRFARANREPRRLQPPGAPVRPRRCRSGATGSSGGARGSPRAAPARWTCRAAPGATGPRSTGATGCSSPATSSAAPGMRGEVSINSALAAARLATAGPLGAATSGRGRMARAGRELDVR